MSTISSLGVASGLELEELVTQLVSVERSAKDSRLSSAKTNLESSLSGMGQLKSALSSFQDALKKLTANNLQTRSATVTQPTANKTYLEAEASSSATAANFDIKVTQLASGSRFESADSLFSSADTVIATSDSSLTFTAGDKSFTVEVAAGTTLNQLRQQINQHEDNFGVNANLINTGDSAGTKLVLTSDVTGAGNDLVITNDNAELDNVSTVPTGTGTGLETKQTAQNAIIEIDGITATSSSNTFENVIQDVTLTAKAVTPEGNNASLTIATDTDTARKNIEAFISTYNSLVDQVSNLTKGRTFASDGKTVSSEGGALNGDSLPRNIMSQLRSIMGGAVAGADSSLATLHAMGITLNSTGKLEISSTSYNGTLTGEERFEKALTENYDNIAALFDGENGIATKLDTFITQFNQTDGIIESREKSIQQQIEKNTKDREAFERYMASYETTLRSRYTALDTLLGSMQSTFTTVSAQLASLPSFTTSSSS